MKVFKPQGEFKYLSSGDLVTKAHGRRDVPWGLPLLQGYLASFQ